MTPTTRSGKPRMKGRMTRQLRSVVAAGLVSAVALSAASCADFGAGGTGERVVPASRLRSIERSDLSEYARATPATVPVEALPTTLPATQPAASIELSLEEARTIALENNLDLRIERISPTIAAQGLSAERAKFEAAFTFDAQYATFDSPTSSRLESSTGDSTSLSPGVRVPLQSGGSVQLDVPVNGSSNDNSFSTLNPAWTAGPGVSFTQPLMRGAGLATNAASIRVAFYASQQAEARAKLEVIRVLANVDRLYWRLFAAQKELEVRRAEFEVASALLQRNRRRFAAKLDPEVEVLRAESALADRLEAVQSTDNAVVQRQRELKRVLNRPGLEMDTPTTIVLTTLPGTLYTRLDRTSLIKAAIANRMELLITELQILSDTASLRATENGMLPLTSLSYSYRVSGLGGSFEEAFAQAGENRFANNTVGFRMEIPLGNEAARARLRQALLSRLQTLATRTQREAQITQELLDAVDALDLARRNIEAAQRRVMLARRLLEAEARLLDAGQRTSTEVLEAQSRLASARSAEVLAVTNFQIAQVDIAFASGTLLGSGNVTWDPAPAPKVGRFLP